MEKQRQEYKGQYHTTDLTKQYAYKMASFLSLRCLQAEDCEDFCIAANIDGTECFEDIVLQIKRKSLSNITFMVQLKHYIEPTKVTQEELLAAEGDFSLAKCFSCIANWKEEINHATKKDIIANLSSSDNVYFVLFTSRGLNHYPFLETHPEDISSILNTCNANNSVLRLNSSNLPNNFKKYDSDCSKFTLLCDQVDVKHADDQILEEIKKFIAAAQLKQIDAKCIAKEFTSFVTEFCKGNLEGHYYMTKQDVNGKLSELLLRPYEVDLLHMSFTPIDSDQQRIWAEIVKYKFLTIVEADDLVLSFLVRYLSVQLNSFLKYPHKVDEEQQYLLWSANLLDQGRIYDLFEFPARIVGNHANITFMDIYRCLWLNDRLPLLLEIDDIHSYKNVLNILAGTSYRCKVILLNKTSKSLERGTTPNCFYTMKNLDPVSVDQILQQPVKLQGRSGIALRDLVDENMFEYIKCCDIISILCNNFSIDNEAKPLPPYFMERSIRKQCINRKALQDIENEIFVLENFKLDFISGLQVNHLDTQKLREVDFGNLVTCRFITIEGDNDFKLLDQLKTLGKPVHRLYLISEDIFEWRWSFGCTNNISRYAFRRVIPLSEIINAASSHIHILSAAPGEGKSVLMDYIVHHSPSSKWVVKIDLNEHRQYFQYADLRYADMSNHLHYFNRFKGKHTDLAELVFQRLLRSTNIVVLLDGFDEVSVSCKQQVTDMIEYLQVKGFAIWVTTRPVMKKHLEEKCSTFALTLAPFSTLDRQLFLIKYFKTKNSDLVLSDTSKLLKFVDMLLVEARKNLNDRVAEFTGIPLQSTLLAEVFNEDCRKWLGVKSTYRFNTKFDLVGLYQKFIDKKIYIFSTTRGAVEEHMEVEEDQLLFSLMLVFPLNYVVEVGGIKQTFNSYINDIDKIELLQKTGVVTIDEELNIRCIHYTFAEYLAGKWLFKNMNNPSAQILIKQRFNPNYKFVFNMFDRLVAVDCPLHLAIANYQIDQARRIIEVGEDSLTRVDAAGRSILHVAALYANQVPVSFKRNSTIKFQRSRIENDVMLKLVQNIPCELPLLENDVLHCNPLDYALANRSLGIASELCNKFQITRINAVIPLELKESYLACCSQLQYKQLFKLLLPYFAARDLLLKRTQKNTDIRPYCGKDSVEMLSQLYKTKALTILELLQSEDGYIYSKYKKKAYSDLRFAVLFGSDENVSSLLLKNVNLEGKDLEGNTALHYAVIHGKAKAVERLVSKGANVNSQNCDKNTPLHLAILENRDYIAKFLIHKGARANVSNLQGATVLHLVGQTNFSYPNVRSDTENIDPIIKPMIRNGAHVNAKDKEGNTVLHYAAAEGYTLLVEELLAIGANVQKRNDSRNTPLHLSSKRGQKESVKLLLDRGVDLEKQNEDGDTSLHLASQMGQTETVKLLLTMGANITTVNKYKTNALQHAVEAFSIRCAPGNQSEKLIKRYIATIEVLVENGADPAAENKNGDTALHYVATYACTIPPVLCAVAADLNKPDRDGNRPLHLAFTSKGHQGQHISMRVREGKVMMLLKFGADVNVANKNGTTALHLAARYQSLAIVQKLLLKGAEVNHQDRFGNTPLHEARGRCAYQVADFLISKGANAIIKNNEGLSANHDP